MIKIFLTISAVIAAASTLSADTLELIYSEDGKKNAVTGKTESIENGEITCGGAKYNISDAGILATDAPRMPESLSALILNDGSRLSGKITGREKGSCIFKTPSFGELKIPSMEIATIIYDARKLENARPVWTKMESQAILLANGKTLRGRVYYADTDSVGFAEENGTIKKYSARTNVAAVFRAEAEKTEFITLRNGDIINTGVKFKGTVFDAEFAGNTLKDIPLSAVSRIVFNAKEKK